MATWGGLNPALTSWRNGINRRLPGRDTRTDGARADKAHGSTSQHQEDADGTVDAFDQDINVLKSSVSTGTATEDRIVEAMKRDFEQDPHERGQLWIEDRQIANADIDDWRVRDYDGDSPHTAHIHWQSRQSKEHIGADWPMPHLDALLRELGITEQGEEDSMLVKKGDTSEQVKFWQFLLRDLGYTISTDGSYGPAMEKVVNEHRKKYGEGPNPQISAWHAWRLLADVAEKRAGKPGKDGMLSGRLRITGGALDVEALPAP